MDQFRQAANQRTNRSAGGATGPGSRRPGDSSVVSPSTRRMLIAGAVIFGLFLLLAMSASFWVDWWWFGSIGYRQILTTRLFSQIAAFVLVGGLAALFFLVNCRLAVRRGQAVTIGGRGSVFTSRLGGWLIYGAAAVVGLSVGAAAGSSWETWRLFLVGGSFGIVEPTFGRDAAFYVFRLPVLSMLQQGAVAVLLPTIAAVVAIYAVALGLERIDLAQPPRPVRAHLLILAAAFLVIVALGYLLGNFRLVYSTRGFPFGVGFTDATVVLPLNYILAGVSLLAAALVAMNVVRWRGRLLAFTGIAWLAAVVLAAILPGIVQQAFVAPSELSRERPYIANNIALTRAAYDLESAETRPLSGRGEPPPAALSPDSEIFDNIRLWDYRIARQTFNQVRSFVPYYFFPDVDVDRYEIDGRDQQVLISAREMSTENLPANVQTWGNEHFAYTHGYGVVVSPISEQTAQGLPRFLVGNIPPEGEGELAIERPEIYFGEITSPWVAVNTRQQEISGLNDDPVVTSYAGEGRGSVTLSNYLARLVVAWNLGENRLLLSGDITPESRILLRRSISERARAVAPFLLQDNDPYIVIVDGRLVWVIDAYTATDRFPGSTPNGGLNYLRHTAKITVDAYDGTVTLYRTEVPDPIADAYGRIYGNIFVPIAEAPATLREHFRYPESLFNVQSEMFAAFHVTDPAVFYNGDDRWEIAEEEVEAEGQGEGGSRPMEAYYMTLPLPGESETSFKLVRPFTPNDRPNMSAWMAAQADDGGGGRLMVYRFPRQENVFGPQQVEARINQDPEISERITLLDQVGSRVLRGNLLVIPIGETVIYVQPLYLQATASQGAPTELQFVIVATADDVEMRPTLAEALAAVAGREGDPQESPSPVIPGEPGDQSVADLTELALAAFDRGQDALTRGDWQTYGEAQVELEEILRRLADAQAGNGPPREPGAVEPVATPGS